jgi:hypothetical protein
MHASILPTYIPTHCKLAAQIDLRRIRRNASLMWLTFSSEILVFPDFTCNRRPAGLSLLSQNRTLFCVVWHPYCLLKWHWTASRDYNSASHNTDWTWFCGVDIVTEPAESHQLAHVHNPGIKKKTFRAFLFDDINKIRVWQFPRYKFFILDTFYLDTPYLIIITVLHESFSNFSLGYITVSSFDGKARRKETARLT